MNKLARLLQEIAENESLQSTFQDDVSNLFKAVDGLIQCLHYVYDAHPKTTGSAVAEFKIDVAKKVVATFRSRYQVLKR